MEPETSAPVMDVSAPPTAPKSQQPVLATAPPETKSEDKPQPSADDPKPESKEKPKAKIESKVLQPKNTSNSVTAAIVATVFIVFGLAALATYAYFKQNT